MALRVGFVGLGAMGTPMAASLLRRHAAKPFAQVLLCDNDPALPRALAVEGGTPVDLPQLCARSERIVLCLPNSGGQDRPTPISTVMQLRRLMHTVMPRCPSAPPHLSACLQRW
jgi:hypothetical protein